MLEIRSVFGRVTTQVVLTLMIVPFAFPLIAMIQGSLGGDRFGNYRQVLVLPELPLFFRNSLLYALGTVVLAYACTMLAAFALAKLRLRGKEVFFYLLLLALTMPSAALTVPLYIVVQRIGLLDNPVAVILPLVALAIPFNVLLARGFVAALPEEVFESARMDGCGNLRMFWHIVLPLTRPISAVIVVWTFLASWNEYLLPLLFLQNPDKQVVTQLPQYFTAQYGSDQTKIFAGAVLVALPTVVVYLALQRLFERGLTAGAVK
jgi:ABC-type glycerol-3-phosphate transport system permease component